MKTIEKGMNLSEWTIEITCPHCGSVLEICADDISMYTRKSSIFLFLSKFEECYDVTCPECDLDIGLDDRNIPYIVRSYLIDKMSIGQFLLNYYFNRK